MKATVKRLRQVLLFTLLGGVAGLSSCLLTNSDITETSYVRKKVAFSLSVPSLGPATYAMSPNDQDNVQSIQILVFDNSGNFREKTDIPESAIDKSELYLSIRRISFTVDIPEGDLSLVILANAASIVKEKEGLLSSGYKKDSLANLLVSYIPDAKEIPAEEGSTIPMWGKWTGNLDNVVDVKATIVDGYLQQAVPHVQGVTLHRMLAKVNVKIEQAAQAEFKLQEIYVYNTYDMGSVVPKKNNWDDLRARAQEATIPWSAGAVMRGKTSAGMGNGKGENAPALHYWGSAITTPNIESRDAIFLFESDNSKPAEFPGHTCLVLGGVYNGVLSYYRVDFIGYKPGDESGEKVYLDILRNQKYEVSVNKISGVGAPSADEAFNTKLGNIEATVSKWDETEIINNVFTDGQYRLSLSALEYNFDSNLYGPTDLENQLTISTTHPNGWKIDSIMVDMLPPRIDMAHPTTPVSQKWLMPTNYTGTSNVEKTIHLEVDSNNTVTTPPNTVITSRSATVYISAGSISAQVLVRQSNMQLGRLTITDRYGKEIRELTFNADAKAPSAEPAPQQFRVSWKPKNGECLITRIGGSDNFIFDRIPMLLDSLGLPLDIGGIPSPTRGGLTMTSGAGSGTQMFTIKPPRLLEDEIYEVKPDYEPPFLEKLTQVNFFIYTGLGGYKSESIVLRQIHYALVPVGLKDSYLPDDPDDPGDVIQHEFTIKSNARWKILSVTETVNGLLGGGNIEIGTSGGQDNLITAKSLQFVTTPRTGIVTIIFGSEDRVSPKFDNVKVEIRIDQPPTVDVPQEIFLTESKPLTPDGITITSCEVGRANVAMVTQNKATGVWSVTGLKADTTRITVNGKSSNGVFYPLDKIVHVNLPTEWYVASGGHRNNSGFYPGEPLATMDSVLSSIKRVYELHTVTNGDIWPLLMTGDSVPASIIASGVLTHTEYYKNMVDIIDHRPNALSGDKERAYPPILIEGSNNMPATLMVASTASSSSVVNVANGNIVTLGSNLTLIGGKGQSNRNGGAVCADSAKVYLDGATIMGGSAITNVSGVYLTNNSLFELRNGTISSNKGSTGGYGVYADSSRIIMRNTVAISNNGSHGVYLYHKSQFEMDGGVIDDNDGNGVLADSSTVTLSGSARIANNGLNGIQANSVFTMSSGEITDNGQNGVYYGGATVDTIPTTPAQFVMSGGAISTNAKSGVRVESRRFVLQSGTINGNGGSDVGIKKGVGGGVYVGQAARFEMRGGIISEHLNLTYGGGVSVEGPDAWAILTGGKITYNHATNGGGVYLSRNEGNHFLKQGTNSISENTATIGQNVRAGDTDRDEGSRNVNSPSGEILEAWVAGGLWAYDTIQHWPWSTAP